MKGSLFTFLYFLSNSFYMCS